MTTVSPTFLPVPEGLERDVAIHATGSDIRGVDLTIHIRGAITVQALTPHDMLEHTLDLEHCAFTVLGATGYKRYRDVLYRGPLVHWSGSIRPFIDALMESLLPEGYEFDLMPWERGKVRAECGRWMYRDNVGAHEVRCAACRGHLAGNYQMRRNQATQAGRYADGRPPQGGETDSYTGEEIPTEFDGGYGPGIYPTKGHDAKPKAASFKGSKGATRERVVSRVLEI